MAVLRLDITSRELYAEGAAFGDTGPYERLDGTAHFAVDPSDPANRAIVDLDRAARDADGAVHFSADFCLLRPADPSRGSGRLLYEVVNRGRKTMLSILHRAPYPSVPQRNPDPGDGFLLRRGWILAWCGWQWDVVPSEALMGLNAPQALGEDGEPIKGQVLCWFQPTDADRDRLLADRIHRPYPAADVNEPGAVLYALDWMDGPREIIPRDRWRFARDEAGTPVPDDTRVWLEGGFTPGRIYELVYTTRICPVVGTGLLVTRDVVSFLRHASGQDGNPAAGSIRHAYGFGQSQSGRFLRHYLHLGLNLDEGGRQVFDGLHIHVAGARRGEYNHRYAQPSSQMIRSFGHQMPFTDDEQTDPVTGQSGGLLSRQRALGGLPRIVATNTSAEYWRGDCSLLHTDIEGKRDVEPAGRVYHLAGTQHIRGTLPARRVGPDGQRGAHDANVVDYAPLMRAALINLDRWVTEGIEPPLSAFPRLADGTAVSGADVINRFAAIPGVTVPDPGRLPRMRRVDVGPRAAEGVGTYPAGLGEPYPTYVPAVDADCNEVAGVRLPDLTVPLATHTGWNPRAPETGGAGQIMNMQGSSFPFPATAAGRIAGGDPRPAIEERYASKEDYLSRVRTAAEALVKDRYLLAEDVQVVLAAASERWDAFAGT